MKLVINKKYSRDFVYNYLPKYINDLVVANYNPTRAYGINQELKINLLNVFIQAVRTLRMHETGASYMLLVNKNVRVKNKSLEEVINYITYGSRTFKGYPLLLNVFNTVSNNLYIIYQRWLDEH